MTLLRCIASYADLRGAPDLNLSIEDQVLFGQSFEADRSEGEWHFGQALDLITKQPVYEGWVEAKKFSVETTSTHKIISLRAPVFSRADIKSPIVMSLSLGSRLTAAPSGTSFYKIQQGYLHANHVAPLGEIDSDYVAVAERYLLLPYVWGGKSADGVDCSGLVQNALWAAGISAPRDSGPQSRELGGAVKVTPDLCGLIRGDLVFWTGHVAIMIDEAWIIHANAHHMMTQIESLEIAAKRIKKSAGDITSIRRFSL